MARVPDLMRSWRVFRSWPRPARWASYTAVVVVLLMVAGLVAGVVVVRKSWPQTDGEIEIAGLDGQVRVVRDDKGIPQIYADTTADLMRAQGFVTAQDRFFEMDVRRHVTAGRTAELFGEDGLETDKFVRTLGWRRVAEQELPLLDADTRRRAGGLQPGRQRLPAGPVALGHLAGVLRALARRARLHARGVEPGRLAGLAQGDGVGPARQHGRRDRPGAGRGQPHPRAGRRALPRLPLRRAPADRPAGRGRRRALRVAGDRSRDPQPGAAAVHRRPGAGARRPPGRPRRDARAVRPRLRAGQQQLGRRRRALRDGQAAARQRPAPRHQPAGHLVPGRPALQRGLRGLSRTTSRGSASPACRAW